MVVASKVVHITLLSFVRYSFVSSFNSSLAMGSHWWVKISSICCSKIQKGLPWERVEVGFTNCPHPCLHLNLGLTSASLWLKVLGSLRLDFGFVNNMSHNYLLKPSLRKVSTSMGLYNKFLTMIWPQFQFSIVYASFDIPHLGLNSTVGPRLESFYVTVC